MYVAVKQTAICTERPYVAVCETGTKKECNCMADRRVLLMVQNTKATFTLYVFTHDEVPVFSATTAMAIRVTVGISR